MQLSIVTTMYRSEEFLRAFHERASAAARAVTAHYEIIYVNDGSPDGALTVALDLQARDARVRVIDLSRNFGHHQAMWTGLGYAEGERVFLIDCDLEESPEWLEHLIREQEASGADVVFGVQEKRGGSWAGRWGGRLYYKLFNLLSDVALPENLMTVRLMTRRYVDALLRHSEVSLHIAGLWARTGFLQKPVRLPKKCRREPSYSLLRRGHAFVNTLTASSNQPLMFIFYLGSVMLAAAGAAAAVLVIRRLLAGMQAGWPSLMVSIWLLGGLIIFCQGIQSIYLAKIYLECKRRPIAIVRQVYRRSEGISDERLRLAK
jgi:putative glycosyltransferase